MVQSLEAYHPLLLLEMSDPAAVLQGSSSAHVWEFLNGLGYTFYAFDEGTGLPVPATQKTKYVGENLIAVHPAREEEWDGIKYRGTMSAGEVMTALASAGLQKGDRPLIQEWPSIVLVTAAYNAERYIEEAICSVLQQGYPNLEYYVVDGASTDATVEIIKKYEKQISGWISEPDRGVYDAINKGFAQSTGQIMGWLNANDKLHTDGLFVVGSVFPSISRRGLDHGASHGFQRQRDDS